MLSNMTHNPELPSAWRNMKQLYTESTSERCRISCGGGQWGVMTQQTTLETYTVSMCMGTHRERVFVHKSDNALSFLGIS